MKLITKIHNSKGDMTMNMIQRLETFVNSLDLGDKPTHGANQGTLNSNWSG